MPDTHERFVAFAFAGADLVAETDLDGIISYAAGAFRSVFGRAPESFIGRPLAELIAPVDQETLVSALALLAERGRLAPMLFRIADAERTKLAVACIALPSQGRPARLCFTLGRPPAPASRLIKSGTPDSFARATAARLRAGGPCNIRLLEIAGADGIALVQSEAIGEALERVLPDTVASELAPGRFGVLGSSPASLTLLSDTAALQELLQTQGIDVAVTASHISLQAEGLTAAQAARALRHALSVFTRGGVTGLEEAGLGDNLGSYLQRAGRKAESLRRAIRGGDFSLAFQPIVSLADRVPHHYEALIRPLPIADLPLATPQEFVMLVEALGLAGELDLAVARVACAEAARSGQIIAFNLSGQSVASPDFRRQLIALLRESLACKAGLIVVEMTETAEIDNVAEALNTAEALRQLNVPFCLDDFGAGSTDMRLLRELNANIVKLDGSYVAGVATAGRERAFVAGMVEIARAVGAEVVAERIETEAEAEALRQLGVQFGQGWLFGRPGKLPSAARPQQKAVLL